MTDRHVPLRILMVCTHNRTRSVMMAALLESMLSDRLGSDGAIVRSAGFGPAERPPIRDAVDAMARRGLDVSRHRSRQFTTSEAAESDLILTAERAHVVKITSLSRSSFRHSFTLPEFVARAVQHDELAGLDEFLHQLDADRTPLRYLHESISEIADPTGSSRRAFESSVVKIEALCAHAASILTAARI